MPQLTITAAAINVVGAGHTNIIHGSNSGSYPIYLSSLPDVSATINQGVIGINGTLIWPANKPLYAATDVNQISTLTYSLDGVEITSGTITASQGVSGKLLAVYTQLIDGTVAGTFGAISPYGGGNIGGVLDISQFGSVLITIETNNQGSGGWVADNKNWFSLNVYQNDIKENYSTQQIQKNAATFLLVEPNGLGTPTRQLFEVPATRKYLWIDGYWNIALAIGAGSVLSFTIKIYGQPNAISKPVYVNRGLGMQTGLADDGLFYQAPAGPLSNSRTYLETMSGQALFTNVLANGTSSETDIMYARRPGTSIGVTSITTEQAQILCTSVNIMQQLQIVIPYNPLYLTTTTAAASSAQIQLSRIW